ncbi:MAG: EF-hand domain-containing protein [Xanthobacteraceae bacterium]|jgi:hypothetical protein
MVDRPRAAEMARSVMNIGISGIGDSAAVHAMSGASAGMPPQQKMSSLFDKIAGGGSGSITQQQFDQAFQTMDPPAVFQQQGSSAIFSALDPNGTGSVSKQDFVSGMPQLMVSLRAEGGAGSAPGPTPSQSLATSIQSLNSINPSAVPSNAQPGALFSVSA